MSTVQNGLETWSSNHRSSLWLRYCSAPVISPDQMSCWVQFQPITVQSVVPSKISQLENSLIAPISHFVWRYRAKLVYKHVHFLKELSKWINNNTVGYFRRQNLNIKQNCTAHSYRTRQFRYVSKAKSNESHRSRRSFREPKNPNLKCICQFKWIIYYAKRYPRFPCRYVSLNTS